MIPIHLKLKLGSESWDNLEILIRTPMTFTCVPLCTVLSGRLSTLPNRKLLN